MTVDAEPADDTHAEGPAPAEPEAKNGSSGNGRKTAVRVAALAAAGGATAIAARKAFSSSDGSDSGRKSREGEESLLAAMLKSGWEAARGTLLPVAEDAASGAGEYVARSAPDLIRERLVPRFIAGFQRAETPRGQDDGEDGEP